MDMLPVDTRFDTTTAERLTLGTEEVLILTTCAQSNGDFYAVMIRMPPGGGPPVMHRHAPSEVYHVLEGEFAFYVGQTDGSVARIPVRAGEVMPLAGNVAHTIRNETDHDAIAFQVHAPGGPMEGFTRAAAALAAQGPPSMDDVLAIAEKHGIELLGPVPAAIGEPTTSADPRPHAEYGADKG